MKRPAELELEGFYRRARIDIAQIDLTAHADAKDYAFKLAPGRGLHQPMNAPHWVETHASRSVSYIFIFETRTARIRNRARSFNHYLQRSAVKQTFTPERHQHHFENRAL